MGIQNRRAPFHELSNAESSRAVISASQGKRWMKRGPLGLLGLKPQPKRHARTRLKGWYGRVLANVSAASLP